MLLTQPRNQLIGKLPRHRAEMNWPRACACGQLPSRGCLQPAGCGHSVWCLSCWGLLSESHLLLDPRPRFSDPLGRKFLQPNLFLTCWEGPQ